MKHLILLLLTLCFGISGFGQISKPNGEGNGDRPILINENRAAGDSCGAYFNNYIGLEKTTVIYYDEMRRGNLTESGKYAGRAQRFHANQPIEISGIRFYAFEDNPSVDSLMAITYLHDYDSVNDSVGNQLAVDTCYVTAQSYTPMLINLEVDCYFDTTVTVNDDYVVTVTTPTDDSIKIIRNSDVHQDGNAEGVSFFYYDNPDLPSYTGYYNIYDNLGSSFDVDYLISPRVKYEMPDDFTVTDDTICVGEFLAGCVDYNQVANFSDEHYNDNSSTPQSSILWTWGDGYQDSGTTNPCHTYDSAGVFDIILRDTLHRYESGTPYCAIELTNQITVIDSAVSQFTYVVNDSIFLFTNTSEEYDSLVWDFGDGNTSNLENPCHIYTDCADSHLVTLTVYNNCFTDSSSSYVKAMVLDIDRVDLTTLNIYPNPAKENITIRVNRSTNIEIVDVYGKVVLRRRLLEGNNVFDISNFESGVYFVRTLTVGEKLTRKVIVNH